MREPSRLVKKRGFWALNFAAGCFAKGDSRPTLVTWGARGKPLNMLDLVTDNAEPEVVQATLDAARGMVAADDRIHSYVLWWDGYLTIDDQRTDAVLCEAGVRGEELAFLFVQRYVVEDRELVKLGRPRVVGHREPAFKAPILIEPPWKPGTRQHRKTKTQPAPSRPKRRRPGSRAGY
jgi:hypothetical protein